MQLKIVYLDDEPDLCEIFKDCFETESITIKTFIDPEQAVSEIKKIKPDLVLLDYRLPNTTGLQIAKRLDPEIIKVLITGDLSVQPDTAFYKIFKKPYKLNEMKDFLEFFQQQKTRL
jgi:DNA-binding response OmpR family regulator